MFARKKEDKEKEGPQANKPNKIVEEPKIQSVEEKITPQLLEALKRDGTFKFDPARDSWTCEISNVQMQRLTK